MANNSYNMLVTNRTIDAGAFNIQVEGGMALRFRAELIEEALEGITKTALNRAGIRIKEEVQDAMQEDKHGRVYPRLYRNGRIFRDHQASAVGEAPAIMTGDLFNGIRFNVVGTQMAIGYIPEYGRILEEDLGRDIIRQRLEANERSIQIDIERMVRMQLF